MEIKSLVVHFFFLIFFFLSIVNLLFFLFFINTCVFIKRHLLHVESIGVIFEEWRDGSRSRIVDSEYLLMN
jgi:hypothetical protein